MVKINMMCGKRDFGIDWFHVDDVTAPHIGGYDIYLKTWDDNSVDLLYCSHGIAYLNRDQIIPLLQDWFRVLKPGGVLRLATPDWDVLRTFDIPVIGPLYGKMNKLPIYHKMVYSLHTLSELLYNTGFKNVWLYDHAKTEHPNTGNRNDKYDDCSAAYIAGQLISLNVECNKP